ncbi:cytochrome P450 [Aspergillus glaucus CBS 516.65]|uniref:Cytochrome P450 n=1 Tax=Aspergillus glaucus CBS 516.65 TaxID=1160497 RepID=A0A1L9VH48_ASPGL|nr:hypothetical protein ASPGLDRAFT_173781 [Aspergillus glaucus CBS 516.65]OJJ83192.1 hypothetical protein ASPGLDRAFT_173781 [Aspergillus glaucus CBS 516.65]
MLEDLGLGLWHLTLALALILGVVVLYKPDRDFVGVPTVKYSRYLPTFFNRVIFYAVGSKLIDEGYEKYRDTPFRILKADGDLIVLPAKYINELRNVAPSELSSLDAQYNNVLGKYTNVLVESRLPSLTVAKRLNPAISRLVPSLIDELQYAFDIEVPKCDDKWTPVNAYNMLLGLLTRATTRIICGDSICRNEKWLETVTDYTINVGITVIFLRPFPKFLRPLVAKFLPSVRKLNKQVQFVKQELFIPMINARHHAKKHNPSYQKPDDFLQWMIDGADNPRDADADFMAHNLFIIMSLAVVHTSSMLMTHMLYDLIEMPEYLEPLREEIQATLANGWTNATHSSFISQHHMDSFMKEVQRFNPTGEVSMHRIVRRPVILTDGLVLPVGAHICFAAGPLSRDPKIIPDPTPFSGLRWSVNPEIKTNSFVSIGPHNMHFGFGRQACPGRFFASVTIKAIMSRIIAEYEFKYEGERKERPANVRIGEQIMPNVGTNIVMRKRKGVVV